MENVAKQCHIGEDDLLYQKGDMLPNGQLRRRTFLPKCLIPKVISACHNDPLGNHGGRQKTIARVAEHFFWPRYQQDVKAWVRACTTCGEIKPPKNVPPNTLHQSTRNSRPMSDVSIDLTGQLPTSKRGNRFVLNVRCNTTRYTEFFPMRTVTTAAVADILFKQIICRYGSIRRLHSDNGPQFASSLCRALCDHINTKKTFSTSYYPQSNGSVERSMYATNIGIYAIASKNKGNWCDFIKCIMTAHNSGRNVSTNASPHLLMYCYDYELPIIVALGIPEIPLPREDEAYKQEFLKRIQCLREKAIEYDKEYQRKTKEQFDQKARPHTYEEGDRVYVQVPKPRFGYTKASAKYNGPYILGPGNETTFKLF